ncbi:pH-response regulator protein palH/rim21 [Neurospora sp. IMI 360204]|nr:pH-response regulator protein palH/rim21 [Neurospora sp. IMI 360204]
MQRDENSRWDLRARVEEFAATQAEKLREKFRPTLDTNNLPVTVIPAPPRSGAALAQLREDEELNLSSREGTVREESRNSNASGTHHEYSANVTATAQSNRHSGFFYQQPV